MNKIATLLLLLMPFTAQAKYNFNETLFIPIEQTSIWQKSKQSATEEGTSITRFVQGAANSELLTIQFKDRELVQGRTAEEAMKYEQSLSPLADWVVIKSLPNDIIYERTFPSGEHELVRMVMTKKGLHRAAFLKRGSPIATNQRSDWLERLSGGVIGR